MKGSQQTSRGGQGLPRVTIKRTWGGLVPAPAKPAFLWAESWHMGGVGRAADCPLQRTPPPAPEPQRPGMGVGKLTSGIGWHVRSGLHRPHLLQDGLLEASWLHLLHSHSVPGGTWESNHRA